MFLKKKDFSSASAPEFLIVGLGNPGEKYEYTRHNAGFLTLDRLCVEENFKINKIKHKALLGDVKIGGHRCIVMKPQTFMNNSGEAVREAASFYKIPPQNIIVVFDDISLPCGKIRIRRKGSDGGHNGIKSIIYHLKSNEFPRVKVGVGAKPRPDYDLADWVLSTFKKDELEELKKAVSDACEAIRLITQSKTDEAMNRFN
ncbi:MAG: aminoacyl-tRNA hydrolase [Oscillospiraceae bacterium]|nr:aminoacyl-tRNA hydrolase [Oscillospiraceae bacterium]